MLHDCPCVGPNRTYSSKSAISQRQPQRSSVCCSQSTTVDRHPITFHSVDTIFRKLLKRSRSQEDTDGEVEEHTQRKKRRLRLDLVTSRLSRPYAVPATHIIGTKAWRVGAWARQKFAGGKLLRKAAILNWTSMKAKRGPLIGVKIRDCAAGHAAPRYGGSSHWNALSANDIRPNVSSMAGRSPQQFSATAATFEMPSDYDAFDYEDDVEEDKEEENEESHEEDSSDEEDQAIYSDFSQLEASDTDPDFFDTSWSFANIATDDPEVDPTGVELKLVMENENQDEVSIAPARAGIFSSLHTRGPLMGV